MKKLLTVIEEMGANQKRAEELTAGLSREQFNWRAAPGRWSIAECLTHLNLVNGPDLIPLRAAIEEGRSKNLTGSGPFRYGFFSRKFVASMEPPAKRKFKAPQTYQPPPQAGLPETLAEYRRICTEFQRVARSAEGLDLVRVKTDLPALPAPLRRWVKMPIGARFALIETHDRRHLWQAGQVRSDPDFPK